MVLRLDYSKTQGYKIPSLDIKGYYPSRMGFRWSAVQIRPSRPKNSFNYAYYASLHKLDFLFSSNIYLTSHCANLFFFTIFLASNEVIQG
jgi:hypothetical protein